MRHWLLWSSCLLPLVACGPKASDGETADTSGGGDTGNPIVPDGYAYLWDIDASSCDDGDAIVYRLFEGAIDGSAHLSGREGWYWFFGNEGWEGDCVDTFTVEGDQDTASWQDDVCYGCERLFSSDFNLADSDRGCPGHDYETFWELEDEPTDRFDVAVLFDALSPSGNPNADNAMLVVTSYRSGGQRYYDPGYGRGHYTPDTADDFEGPAAIDWASESGVCVTFREEPG